MKLSLLIVGSAVTSTAAFAPTFVSKVTSSSCGVSKLYAEESTSSSAFVPLEDTEQDESSGDSLDAVEKLGRGAAKVSYRW